MKHNPIIIICAILMLNFLKVSAQTQKKDTVLFLVDKNMKEYEYYTPRINDSRFHIIVRCNYYTAEPVVV